MKLRNTRNNNNSSSKWCTSIISRMIRHCSTQAGIVSSMTTTKSILLLVAVFAIVHWQYLAIGIVDWLPVDVQVIDRPNCFNCTKSNLDDYIPTGVLLPSSINWWRRNLTIPSFIINEQQDRVYEDTGLCSCRNPLATRMCCQRSFYSTHKMGYTVSFQLFMRYRKNYVINSDMVFWRLQDIPDIDFRSVLLFRNIYEALVSGYRYHLKGHECWLHYDGKKKSIKFLEQHNWRTWNWQKYVQLPIQETASNRSKNLCEYLQNHDEKTGMKAYIDFVFHLYYNATYGLWGLSHAFPTIKERTSYICYNDFISVDHDLITLNNALSFLFNTTSYTYDDQSKRPGGKVYTGPHSTSHHANPNHTQHLLQIINELDKEVFDGEIAWIDSVIPC